MSDPKKPPAPADGAPKSFWRRVLDFFSPDYCMPQPKGRRIQGGPAQTEAFWDEMRQKQERAAAERRARRGRR